MTVARECLPERRAFPSAVIVILKGYEMKYVLYMSGKRVFACYSKVSVLREVKAIERIMEVNGWDRPELVIIEERTS